MVYKVPSAIANISDITIKVYPHRMGRNQIASFERYVRTGVITANYSAPATLARAVRRYHSLPSLHLCKRELAWEGMNYAPPAAQEQFFANAATALCAYELGASDAPHGRCDVERIQAIRDALQSHKPTHSFWLGWNSDAAPFKLLLKGATLGEYTGPMPTAVFLKEDARTATALGYELGE